jgi:hypothetical protein
MRARQLANVIKLTLGMGELFRTEFKELKSLDSVLFFGHHKKTESKLYQKNIFISFILCYPIQEAMKYFYN